jgi:hypothetical protein
VFAAKMTFVCTCGHAYEHGHFKQNRRLHRHRVLHRFSCPPLTHFFACVVKNPHGTKLILSLSFIIVFWVLARFAIKILGVLLQTFVVPGTSVSFFFDIISACTECDAAQLKKFGAGKGAWAGTFFFFFFFFFVRSETSTFWLNGTNLTQWSLERLMESVPSLLFNSPKQDFLSCWSEGICQS